MLHNEIKKNLRFNFTVNTLDGTFFGLTLGFASYVTVIPLFVETLTDSTTIIGLIATVQLLGWQIPQMLTAQHVAGLWRYKPMVLIMTLHERWPFFGLAVVALLVEYIGTTLSLIMVVFLTTWQALGGGLTGTPWQSMISKVIPGERRGTFYGAQAGAASFTSAIGAIAAGFLLERMNLTNGFALTFALAGIFGMISFWFLSKTREPKVEPTIRERTMKGLTKNLSRIWKRDVNFRWYIYAKYAAQFSFMALAFITVYATREFNMDKQTAGLMTGLYLFVPSVSALVLGWAGDRWGHRLAFAFGTFCMSIACVLLLIVPSLSWFYLIYALGGVVAGIQWATVVTLNSNFGNAVDRPFYIGMSNTLTAPVTLMSPIIGGWLADTYGFEATFIAAAIGGVVATVLLLTVMHEPKPREDDSIILTITEEFEVFTPVPTAQPAQSVESHPHHPS